MVGGTRANGAFPNVFVATEKLVIVGVAWLTVRVAVSEPDIKLVVLACVAVMVAMPPPTMVTVLPTIVATAVFELVYVKEPVLLVVGATRAKAAFPNVFVIAEKLVITGVAWLTTRDAVMDVEP